MATSLEASLRLRDQFTAVLQKVDSSMQKATKSMQDFKQKVSGPAQAMNQMAQAAAASVNKLNSSIKSGMEKASNVVKSTTERILSNFGNFGNRISGKLNLSGVTNKFTSAFSSIQSKVSSGVSAVGNVFSSLKAKISGPFNAAVSVVKNGATKIKNFLKQSGNAFKEFGNDAKAGMSKIESAFSPLGTFLKAGAVAGGAALVGLGKKVYDVAGTFDTQMSRVKAISGATGESFKQLESQAIDLGAKTAFSAIESASGMENLASAGFNAQEIMAAMPGLLDLAAVSGGDVALASENAATALRGFGMDAGQAGHVADVFARAAADTNAEVADMGEAMKYVAPVAKSMGLSIEEVAASIGIMSDAGVKGSQAGTTLRGALSRLAKPTDPMISKMDELGLSFYDANGQMKPLTEQVGMLQNAFKGLTPEQQQNALVTLYGQESLAGMMELVAKGPEALGKLTKSLKDSDGAAADMAATMQDNLKSKVEQLGGAIESTLILLNRKVGPLVGPIIDNVTDTIAKAFSEGNIDKAFDKLSKYGSVLKSAFDDIKGPVSDALGAVGDSLNKITGGFGSKKSVDGFKDFVEGIAEGIKKLANFAEKHSDGIAKLISIMPKVAAAFVGFKLGKGILTPFLDFGSGIMTLTKGFGKLGGGLAQAIGGLFTKLPKKAPSLPIPGGDDSSGNPAKALSPFQTFLGTMNSFAKGATNLALAFGVIKLIEQLAQAMQEIDEKVPNDLSQMGSKLLNMGIALTGMGAFVKLTERFSKDTKGAIRGLAVVAGISGNLILAAVAMQQINNRVPDDIGSFASKMANMGIAIGGMGVLVLVAGKLASMNPAAAIAGLAVIAGISLELMLAAEAMKQVNDKVPDDIGNFASKVANMAIAIGGMSVLVAAVGALTSTGIGAIIGGAGLLAVAALAGEIMLVAEAIAQMDAKVPDDLSSVKAKIDNISKTIGYFTEANLGSVLDIFSNLVGNINVSVVTSGIEKFSDLAIALVGFDAITVPDSAEEKLKRIMEIIEAFAGSNLGSLISDAIWTVDLYVVKEAFDKLIDIGNTFSNIEQLDFNLSGVKTKVGEIQEVIDYLGNSGGIFSKLKSLVSNTIDSGSFSMAEQAFDQLVNVGNSLVALEGITFKKSAVEKKIDNLTSIIEKLSSGSISSIIGSMVKQAELSQVQQTLEALNKLVTPLNLLGDESIKASQAISKIRSIQNVIEELGSGSIAGIIGTMVKAAELDQAVKTLESLNKIVAPLNLLGDNPVKASGAISRIRSIKNVIEAIGTGEMGDVIGTMLKASQLNQVASSLEALNRIAEPLNLLGDTPLKVSQAISKIRSIKNLIVEIGTGSLGETLGTMLKAAQLDQVKASLDAINRIVTALNLLGDTPVQASQAISKIRSIKNVIIELSGTSELTGTMISAEQLAKVQSAVNALIGIRDSLNQFGGTALSGEVSGAIAAIKTAIQQLSTITAGGDGGGLQGVASGFSAVTQQMSAFNTTAQSMGTGISTVASTFQSSMTTIKTSVETTMASLPQVATTGMTGFNNAIATGMSQSAATARSGSAQIVSAFSGLRGQLQSAGSYAMSGLTAGINAGASSAIAAANSVANQVAATVRKALDIHSPSRVMMAVGGFVSAGLAKGITAAQNLVSNASSRLATAAVPSPLADVSASGNVTSTMKLDDSEVESLKASSTQTVVVQHKQVVPQVVINVENKDGEPIDTDALLQEFEDKVMELYESDLS